MLHLHLCSHAVVWSGKWYFLFLLSTCNLDQFNPPAGAVPRRCLWAPRGSQRWDVTESMGTAFFWCVPTGWGYCEMLVGLPFAGVWGIHLRVIQTQASNNTVGSLHSWTHSDSCRVFLPKRLYFSGWHLLCLTLNSSNFHGIHIHCGFSVEFLILTFYCLCTSFEILFFSFVWCQPQWLRKVLVLLHHM